MGSFELSDRSRRLLATLIREYVETGEPVSSQILARRSGLGLSSATVRNVLTQLEEAGYVHQPHTSAGRVPTDRGYRFFVDLLLGSRRPSRPTAAVEYQLRQQAERSPLFDDLLASVSHFVSRASRHVGFALADNSGGVLQRIEFVPLGGTRVLVVVVSSGNQVTQKSVDAGEPLKPEDLAQAANYLNTEFSGLELDEVRDEVIERLREERTLYDQLLTRALRLANQTLEQLPKNRAFFVDGASSLVGTTGLGLLDYQTTPLGERLPGIEIHARILENIFEDSLLRRPGHFEQLERLLLFGCGLILTIRAISLSTRRMLIIRNGRGSSRRNHASSLVPLSESRHSRSVSPPRRK